MKRYYEVEEPEDWEEDLPYQVRRRDDSESFVLRFSIKGYGQQRFGLGTKNKREAHAKVRSIYYRSVGEAEAGTLGTQKKFSRFANEYAQIVLDEAKTQPQKLASAREIASAVKNYFNPILGDKVISAITVKDLKDYIKDRKVYWITGKGKDREWIEYIRGPDTPIHGRLWRLSHKVHYGMNRKVGKPKADSSNTSQFEWFAIRPAFRFGLEQL